MSIQMKIPVLNSFLVRLRIVIRKMNSYYVGERGDRYELLQFDVHLLPSGSACPSSSTFLPHFLFAIVPGVWKLLFKVIIYRT
jgi:hypothetical protein